MIGRLAFLLVAILAVPVAAADRSIQSRVRAEIMPAFEAMQAAANVHDVEGHVGYLANDPGLIFVINGRRIIGWQAVLEQQRKWWPDGRIPEGSGREPPYRLTAGPDFVVIDSNSALLSFILDAPKIDSAGKRLNRTLAVSQLWQRRPEGWRATYVHESVVEHPPAN